MFIASALPALAAAPNQRTAAAGSRRLPRPSSRIWPEQKLRLDQPEPRRRGDTGAASSGEPESRAASSSFGRSRSVWNAICRVLRRIDPPLASRAASVTANANENQYHLGVPCSRRTEAKITPELPPLRILAGSAVGIALANGVAAQPASPPAPTEAAVQLPPIAVQGTGRSGRYQSAVPSLSKLTQPLVDTPQSITVIPQQLMEDQGVTAVREALRNVPGISLAAGEAGAQGDSLTLRGFNARNDFYLDGMRDFGSYYRDPFNLNEIEVLKGPASILFGRGSTGGVINQVSKQPQLAPITAGTGTVGTDRTFRFTTDIDRPIEGVPNSAFRLNLMGNLNGMSARDAAEYRRFGIAPSVAFGIGTDTRLTLSYFHLQEDNVPDYGLPWFFASPAPVARHNFYGFPNDDFLRTQVDIGTVKFEHDFNDHVTIRDQFRYANYQRAGRITEPQMIYTGVTPNTPLSQIARQSQFDLGVQHRRLSGQSDGCDRPVQHRSGRAYAGRGDRTRARDLDADAHPVYRRADRQPADAEPEPAVRRHSQHPDADQYALQQLFRLPGGHDRDRRALGADRRLPLGHVRDVLQAVHRAGGVAQPHRQHAELSRRHRLQAVAERQCVFRLRHVVQSVGRDALACRQHRRSRAGGERDLRAGHQMGWSTMAAWR